jgi:hypothetical protein
MMGVKIRKYIMKSAVFWLVTPCSLQIVRLFGGHLLVPCLAYPWILRMDAMFLRNVLFSQNYTASQPFIITPLRPSNPNSIRYSV